MVCFLRGLTILTGTNPREVMKQFSEPIHWTKQQEIVPSKSSVFRICSISSMRNTMAFERILPFTWVSPHRLR
jgi:hypothetical protein